MNAMPIRVCMLSYSFYENDGRVKRYAEALAHRGDQVDVISLRRPGQSSFETIKGVTVHRIQERTANEGGKASYLSGLLKFFVRSTIFVSKLHLKNRYALIHVHSIPDFEIFAAFLPKLLGSKLILDIHDIVPELYVSKFRSKSDGLLFKMLVRVERWACKFADHVIAANHIWEKKLLLRSVTKDRCTTILNYPDPAVFAPRPRQRSDNRIVMIYPGTLNWHQGLDLAINAFASIAQKYPTAELHIYGRGSELDKLQALVSAKRLDNRVLFKNPVPIEQIAELMANADVGIIPKRNDPFGGEAFSTKSLEFMSVGIPIVVARTRIDSYYFNDAVVRFFEAETVESLAAAMSELASSAEARKRLAANALTFVKGFSWGRKQQEYIDLVDRLICPEHLVASGSTPAADKS
jgi:glycosyltransferase involved in cell wall biosynthesis